MGNTKVRAPVFKGLIGEADLQLKSAPMMRPRVEAYAECYRVKVKVKVVSDSSAPVPLSMGLGEPSNHFRLLFPSILILSIGLQ